MTSILPPATMSFTEPFALASYALPKKEHTPWTHATTPTPAPGRPDGLITVTAQGDGVHILDVRPPPLLRSPS